MRSLVGSINAKAKENEPIRAYIDIHGHSRKKSIFIYGPEYVLHSEKYFKARVIPKLLDENSEMFRYSSCKFNVEPLKERAARVVFNREFNVMNCFTLEASMHGYISNERQTVELTIADLLQMGEQLTQTLSQYCDLVDAENKLKHKLKKQIAMKKRKKEASRLL